MKADAGRIRSALSAPPADIRLYLLHGPDEAGAAALAALLGKAMGAGVERIDFDGATLRGNPGLLADEAASLSLFGGARFIRVMPAGEECLEAFTTLLGIERAGNPVVAIAPTAKATGKIVKLALESPRALAHACYEPTAQEAERIVATLAREAGLQPDHGVARRIAEAAGGDRAIMAREVEKMALYADAAPGEARPLTDEMVDAIGAALDDTDQGPLVAALIDGRPADLGAALERLSEAGTSAIPWLRAAARRLIAMAEMRVEIDRGTSPAEVVKRHRIHWRETDATLAALRRWTPAMLAEAIARTRAAERAIMATGNAGGVLADAAALTIARAAAARR